MAKISPYRISDVSATSINQMLRQVEQDLRNLTFSDNFFGEEVEVSFSGSGEVAIPNPFQKQKLGIIPTRWMVVDVEATTATFAPCRGTSSWTAATLYLKNPAGGSVTAKVRFW
jgi:hypothetical protein